MAEVSYKLGSMRKPQGFVVFEDESGDMIIQSEKSIGRIGKDGKGILNIKGCYFMHLAKFLGAVDFEFPADFIEKCKAVCYKKGDKMGSLGGGVVTFGGTI